MITLAIVFAPRDTKIAFNDNMIQISGLYDLSTQHKLIDTIFYHKVRKEHTRLTKT
jgi:hypothetical protein